MEFPSKKPDRDCFVWTLHKGCEGSDPQINEFRIEDDGEYIVCLGGDGEEASQYLFGDIIEEPATWTVYGSTWKRNRVPYMATKVN